MADIAQWIAAARPRTLPAAVAPVLAGSGAAAQVDAFVAGRAVLALVVAVALQVGVNYANDYSDGVRGADRDRVGPTRLVGAGLAVPASVRNAALAAFGVAAVAGFVLVVLSGAWWLLLVGAAALVAGWAYTGTAKPYGYLGLGEVFVFGFFGLVAVCGTTYVQADRVTAESVLAAVGVGALACAILVANNLRDLATDDAAAKRTLAVRLGDSRTRVLYGALHLVPVAMLVPLAVREPWTLLGLAALPLQVGAVVAVRRGADGAQLLPVLRDTALAELAWAAGVALALA